MEALLISFGVIFVAELGDKSQLMTLTFATRYRAVYVIIGIAAATAIAHALSVTVGAVAGAYLPRDAINVLAGVVFLGFAIWTLLGDGSSEDEVVEDERSAASMIVTVGVAFFLAELGDKTMLATMALAAREGAFGTWLGATLGMVAANGVAIFVGRLLGARLPERAIRIGAAVAFAVFAGLLVWEGLT